MGPVRDRGSAEGQQGLDTPRVPLGSDTVGGGSGVSVQVAV